MDRQTAISLIERQVAEQGRITGSQLNSLLRASDPEWAPTAHGVKTLGAFIASFVPTVAAFGRSGLDPIYEMAEEAREPSAYLDCENLWRVWASPNSPLCLEIGEDGQVQAVERHHQPRAGWVRLATPASDEHRALARDFIALQFPEGDESLTALINGSDDWWQAWFKQIRQRRLSGVWGPFRIARLLATFDRMLLRVGLQDGARESASVALRRSASPGAELQKALSTQFDTLNSSELRSIAATVIERMSEQELATLRLPLGLVLNAIKNAR